MNDNDLTSTALWTWKDGKGHRRENLYDCIWGEAGVIELRCTICQGSERLKGCRDDDHDFVPYMAYVQAWADERHLIGEHDYFPTELCTICN
jgi:hypothetical protein